MGTRRVDVPGKGLIVFEGRKLPEAAKYLEAVPAFPTWPEEVRGWVLDLRYAWGRQRQAPNTVILPACDLIEASILPGDPALHAHLAEVFPGVPSNQVIQDWIASIGTIRELARWREASQWTVPPQPGEAAEFLGMTLDLLRRIEATQGETLVPAELEKRLRSAPEAEQVAFVNRATDLLSASA